MSSVVDFYLRTSSSLQALDSEFRSQLVARGADPSRYWIRFIPAEDEDREDGRRDFGFEPTVIAAVQPARGEGDAALSAAMINLAHESHSEFVALHDGTPLFSYRAGVVYLPPEDREFYEKDVLPGFSGQVDWQEHLLPWLGK